MTPEARELERAFPDIEAVRAEIRREEIKALISAGYSNEREQQNDALVTELIRRDIALFETRVAYEKMQRKYELALVAALLVAAWGWFLVVIR